MAERWRRLRARLDSRFLGQTKRPHESQTVEDENNCDEEFEELVLMSIIF